MSLCVPALEELRRLLAEAALSGDPEPTAMNLSTIDARGRPHSRIVLLKGVAEDGLRFFTNYTSAKGEELAAHAQVALCLHWKQLREGIQVRVEGTVSRLPEADSDAYFASRARGSQIGAWASLQSQTLPQREDFEARIAEVEARFAGCEVERPPHWGGYRVDPDLIEFWYGANFRLHERQRHELIDGQWRQRMLYP
ncbi:pyridoxamine 5'-phosphate oxidase [Tahibacter aquaticus]|uniref:Pyridoxamine 5'-phosphate oxidase n=1 Tax=Tahibacter aquaticus TaxID=520092 RepID=A0A4R6YTL9_9GAMM|nr:pyridoxamine 5'-phosphate oxidase [Tahibacter aquaticus]TDR41644.1 pyridoxamine 5'-phosphate oxidase [Tahibacter aquaticus]